MDTTVKQLYKYLFLLILAIVPFHALLSTWFGSMFGNELLWKSWKELVILVLGLLSLVVVIKRKDIRAQLFNSRINQLIIAFFLVHLLGLALFNPGIASLLAGMAIDLRFFAFFIAAQIAVLLIPRLRQQAIKISVVVAGIVVGFGLLQVFVLPDDFLAIFGYSKETISPFLTVDENPLFVRINSTLRGPNPLSAYVIIFFSFLVSWVAFRWQKLTTLQLWGATFAAIGLSIVLFTSYSRSAALGMIVALLFALGFYYRKFLSAKVLLGGLAVLIAIGGAYYIARDTYVVQNVIEHKNPDDPVNIDSNEGHLRSLQEGTSRMAQEPFGRGPGSAGSASLYSNEPTIIENHYLFVAHEVGWLGLGLFVAICLSVGRELYRKAGESWEALGLLAGLIGLSVVGLLLPVWADDTVALVWWGLAGLFISTGVVDTKRSDRK